MAVTLEQAKKYLRVDGTEDDIDIFDCIEESQIYIDSMVGEAYKTDSKAVKLADLLQLKLISDMYENRGTEIPQNTKQDRITLSILDKLGNYVDSV
jgi:uncharacterized phage protein (predicted DNA packaging)